MSRKSPSGKASKGAKGSSAKGAKGRPAAGGKGPAKGAKAAAKAAKPTKAAKATKGAKAAKPTKGRDGLVPALPPKVSTVVLTGNLDEELAAHPFLAGLSPTHLKAIGAHASRHMVPAGALVLREGGPAGASWLVLDGRLDLEIHAPGTGPLRIASVGPGEICGWSWIVPPGRWHFDARAALPTTAIVLDGDALHRECAADHSLAYELQGRFLRLVTQRLEAVRLQLLDLYAAPGSGRPRALPWL